MTSINGSTTMNSSSSNPLPLDVTTSFCLLLSFIIPSIICSIFVLGHLLFVRDLRQGIHNHSIIILNILSLIYVLVCVSSSLSFNRQNRTVWPPSPIYCLIWRLADTGVYISINVFLSWSSFQRHILVFHQGLINTHHKRIIIHYIPMAAILAYLSIFYIVTILFYPCQNNWNYKSSACGDSCFRNNSILATYELILHGFISIILIAFFNLTLFFRVIYQKIRIHQPIQWKKHRKMAIQLLSLSSLFLSVNFPLYVFIFGLMQGWVINMVAYRLLNYFTSYIIMLFPFVCLFTLPNLKKKIQNLINPGRWFRQHRITPN